MAGDQDRDRQLPRVSSGDATAVFDWVLRYQRALLRELRLRLRDPRLRQALHRRNLWPAFLGHFLPGQGRNRSSGS